MNNRNTATMPTCNCCFPAQTLVVTGQRAYCPITERIHEGANAGAQVVTIGEAADFYPGRQKRRGEAAPLAINPAEERFGKD